MDLHHNPLTPKEILLRTGVFKQIGNFLNSTIKKDHPPKLLDNNGVYRNEQLECELHTGLFYSKNVNPHSIHVKFVYRDEPILPK